MHGGPNRLVSRVRRMLHQTPSADRPRKLAASDIAELAARVRRLHALGDRYAHVELSRFVVDGGETTVSNPARSEYVATDV